MKLTKTKLLETLRRKNDGWTTYQARKIAGIKAEGTDICPCWEGRVA